MPRRAPSGTIPSWEKLYEAASLQAGYFTLPEAARAGFSPQLLRYHVAHGKVAHAGPRGVYRLVMFPPSDDEEFVVAWLWAAREGVMSHETALSLHQISDAMPAKIHLTVPASWARRRLRVPKNVVLYTADVGARDRTWAGPVPVTNPRRTIEDCIRDHVTPDLVDDAIRDARRRGLLTPVDQKRVRELRRRARAA